MDVEIVLTLRGDQILELSTEVPVAVDDQGEHKPDTRRECGIRYGVPKKWCLQKNLYIEKMFIYSRGLFRSQWEGKSRDFDVCDSDLDNGEY